MATLPPPRHKAKHTNVLLLLVLIVLVGAFVAYMMGGSSGAEVPPASSNTPTQPDDSDGGKTADEHVANDKQMKACKAQGRTTGTCAVDGGTVRLKCNDKRYGPDCAKTCHGGDGHSFAEYTLGFDGGSNAATCKCPEKFRFKNTDVARGGCLRDGECADGYTGKDCSSTFDDVQFEGWTEVSNEHKFMIENDGNTHGNRGRVGTDGEGNECGAKPGNFPISLCKAFTMSDDPTSPCITANQICENNMAPSTRLNGSQYVCGIKRECHGDTSQTNISNITFPQNTKMRVWNNSSACSFKKIKRLSDGETNTPHVDSELCKGQTCTWNPGDRKSQVNTSLQFSLAPGHFIKCGDKAFFGAETGSAKMPKNMKNAYRVG